MTSSPPSGYPPPPAPTALWLFERYVRRQAARHFAGVHWAPRGAEGWNRSIPTLFIANHSNWWDGFIAFLATRALGLGFQVLMESRHLARYRAFLRVGALPLRRGQARDAYTDLSAAAWYLRAGTGLWVFPQGERRPAAAPLAGCERGAAHLAMGHEGPLRICPVALRYAFLGEQLPEAFVLIGDEWQVGADARTGRRALMTAIEGRLGDTVGALDSLIASERLEAFRPLAPGRLSVNKRMDRFRHALGLLRGPFEARNG